MKKFKLLFYISLISCMHFIESAAQADFNATRVDRNVVFGMYSGLALVMDVYYPENSNGYGIIHISGSGWSRELSYDARMLSHQPHVKREGEQFVEAGYTLFTINHRAFPRFTYPAAVDDARRAVRFIRHNAEQFGIDPDRIGAVGGSSGGHLVLMLGLLDGIEDLKDDTPINRESSKVQCVIARAAPSDLTGGVGEHFLGLRVRKDSTSIEYKLAREASPIFHVSADDPPVLLIHGDQDDVVPFQLSEELNSRLEEMKVPSKLIRVEGGAHGPGILNSDEVKSQMIQWMDEYLKTPD